MSIFLQTHPWPSSSTFVHTWKSLFFHSFYFSLNVGSISFMWRSDKNVPSGSSLSLFCSRNWPQSRHLFRPFVVLLYSNCLFEFNTEFQDLSSNISLCFSMKLFFMKCLWKRKNKKVFLLTEWTWNICWNYTYDCLRLWRKTFALTDQRSQFSANQLEHAPAPPCLLPASYFRTILIQLSSQTSLFKFP